MKVGEIQALGKIYDRHASAVYALCVQLTENHAEADRLLEEVFWKLWQRRAHLNCSLDSVLTCLLAFAARDAASRCDEKTLPNIVV